MSERTRLTRRTGRGTDEQAVLHYRPLDDARVAHVGFVRKGYPAVSPMAFGPGGDRLALHGSTGAGAFLTARGGFDVSIADTHLAGLAFARSAFDSSVNYRSAVIFGIATPVRDAGPGEAPDDVEDRRVWVPNSALPLP